MKRLARGSSRDIEHRGGHGANGGSSRTLSFYGFRPEGLAISSITYVPRTTDTGVTVMGELIPRVARLDDRILDDSVGTNREGNLRAN